MDTQPGVLAENDPDIIEIAADGKVRHGRSRSEPAGVFYFCPHCNGWVGGWPLTERVSNLGYLSGRRGTVTRCHGCLEELDFHGAIA